MPATVEERVVSMRFDNAAFQNGVSESLKSLSTLNKGLQLQGASKGLNDVGAAAKAQSGALKTVETGVQAIADKFRTMSVVALSALTQMTNRAAYAGEQLIKSFTVAPVMDGFREYEKGLNSIQTIMANTGREGKKGLAEVSAALDELNHYSDQTIYNFGEMAKNIGTFTAAGVDLETSTAAIKGIANLAAVSGSNSQQASAAMYQLSQALSAGKVSLEDWNSVVNAGMGGKVFQQSLMETARLHGVAIDKMVKDEGSFRLTLQNGWLTSDILTETLSKFTGDLSAKQLKQMGYTEKQIKAIIKMGRIAKDSATKVKTISQLMGTLKEAAGSGWAQTWKLIFGDFDEAKSLFTGVNDVLGGFINKSSDARNKIIKDWKELGGRTTLITAIGDAWKGLMSVVRPIRDAFKQIFPPTTGKQLYDLTTAIANFTKNLAIGGETADKLRRTFAGVFAIFGIGWEIIKQITKTLFGLFKTAGEGSGGFLDTTASVGDFLVALHKAIKEGEGLANFFKGLGAVLAVPIKALQFLGGLLGALFSGMDGGDAAESVEKVTEKLGPLGRLGEYVQSVWGRMLDRLVKLQTSAGKIGDKISEIFGKVKDAVSSVFEGMNYSDVLNTINTGLFAGIAALIWKLLSGGGVAGLMDNLGDAVENLSNSLGAMTNTLRAATLLQIAIAVGILAVSMNVLAKIDAAGLARASAAITVMFAQLLGSMLIYEKFSGFVGFAKLPFIMGSMILLAAAVLVLAVAMKKLADLSWEEIAKGLTGVTGLLAAIIAALKFMPPAPSLILTASGLIVLGVAIKVLASAVNDLSGLNWDELAKGLVGVGALLAGLALFTKFAAANKGGLIQGAGILLLAAGIKVLASAMDDLAALSWMEIARGLTAMGGGLILMGAALALIPPTAAFSAAGVLIVAASLGMIADALQDMGSMEWGEIGKGLTVLAGALLLIGTALTLIPPSSILSAAAILVVAGSLSLIAIALEQMGKMDWGEIAKALVLLAGALTIIAVAMIAMLPALPGAAALVVIAGALAILTPILMALGNMSWGDILKGLVALAGVFLVLGAAGLVLGALVPVLIGLGAAITLLGVGVLAAGAGVLLFATGLTALAAAGSAGALAITAIVSNLAGVIPTVMKQIGLGIIAFAKVIATAGPALLSAMTTVLLAIIKAIDKLGPKIVDTLLKVMSKLLDSALKYVPQMVDTGLKLITGILNGIAKNANKVVTAGTNAVVAFIEGISDNIPKVIQAGFDLIIKFLNSLADSIRKNAPTVRAAGLDVADAIIEGMTGGLLKGGASRVAAAAKQVAKEALDAAKDFLGISSPSKEFEKIGIFVNQGFAKGLRGKSKDEVKGAFNELKGMLKDLMKDSAKDVKDATAKLKELTNARDKDEKAIKKAEKALKEARKEHALSTAAYNKLTKSLVDEKNELAQLATQYEKVTARLEAAKDALADARQTRDDYNKQIRDQYSALPDITEETTLEDYIENLEKEVRDTQEFASVIQRLRDMGLNDKMYEELLEQGTEALPFMRQLLAAGKYGVDQVNRLEGQLGTLAANLGKKASTQLYQAGVDAAAALVKGLEAQQDRLEKAMTLLANAMVNAINKALGKAVYYVGGDFKFPKDPKPYLPVKQPKVTPIMSDEAFSLGSKPVSVAPSYSIASGTSKAIKSDQNTSSSGSQKLASSSTTYNQYITSPKAVSAAETYRNTKNLLSTAKGA